MNKKAAAPIGVGNFYAYWPEMIAFLIGIVGFILAATARSAVMAYIIIFLCGTLGGRLWWQKKNDLKMSLFLILVGFFVGFVIGNFYGSLIVTTFSFLAGIMISYNLHERKLLH